MLALRAATVSAAVGRLPALMRREGVSDAPRGLSIPELLGYRQRLKSKNRQLVRKVKVDRGVPGTCQMWNGQEPAWVCNAGSVAVRALARCAKQTCLAVAANGLPPNMERPDPSAQPSGRRHQHRPCLVPCGFNYQLANTPHPSVTVSLHDTYLLLGCH